MSSSEPVRAASQLETWCDTLEVAAWDASTSTCTLTLDADVALSSSLDILAGETLDNNGEIESSDVLRNQGTIRNRGTIDNHLIVINDGSFHNYGTIHNWGTFDNGMLLSTSGVDNYGTIYNLCSAIWVGQAPQNLYGGVVLDLGQCGYLPIVVRE
jgi:hypothetical protein